MQREVRQHKQESRDELLNAEREHRYPNVAALGRVINTDTRLVVVDPLLRDRIVARERLSSRELLFGSVQIWANKVDTLGLEPLPGRKEIYWWPHGYDANFIGYMKGALWLSDISNGGTFIL